MVIGICDDNREDAIRIQQEVCKCLKLFGEEKTITIISEDGRKLLENCRTKMVNLIFLDLEMPECNGFELAEQIYDFNPAIKIIFVSRPCFKNKSCTIRCNYVTYLYGNKTL